MHARHWQGTQAQRWYFTSPHNASLTSYLEANPKTGILSLTVEPSPNDCFQDGPYAEQRKAQMKHYILDNLAQRLTAMTGQVLTADTVLTQHLDVILKAVDPLPTIRDPWQRPKDGRRRASKAFALTGVASR